MPADAIRFVDGISASPTVRLNLNDETSWWVKSFSDPPPRLRRSTVSNAMRDGINVGSATYDSRTLVIELECRKTTQDLAATEIQKLWRELDRTTNWLQYQPNGLTKPVFFRTYRSDTSQLEDVMAQAAMRTFTIEILAEPHAMGLMETLGPYTVSNNPAAGANPCYVDLPTILGDVASPLVYWDSTSVSAGGRRILAVHSGPSATAVTHFIQAEGKEVSDTSNPGGGPDASMSGAGANNFRRTSFAGTTALSIRLNMAATLQPGGSYRAIAAVRRSATTSTLAIQARVDTSIGALVTIPAVSGVRLLVDLGIVTWPDMKAAGHSGVTGTTTRGDLSLFASRTGGTDTLDWDGVLLIPAYGQISTVANSMLLLADSTGSGSLFVVMDGVNDQAFYADTAANPTTTAIARRTPIMATGGTLDVTPNTPNRLYAISSKANTETPVTGTTTVTLAYWPRYVHTRPVAS